MKIIRVEEGVKDQSQLYYCHPLTNSGDYLLKLLHDGWCIRIDPTRPAFRVLPIKQNTLVSPPGS